MKPTLALLSSLRSFSLVMSTPSIITVPDVGLSRPPSMFKRVDLPEPDGPMIETKSPRSITRLTPSKALMDPFS